jgi:hypothetical protein
MKLIMNSVSRGVTTVKQRAVGSATTGVGGWAWARARLRVGRNSSGHECVRGRVGCGHSGIGFTLSTRTDLRPS